MEFGSRRAQGYDGAIYGARASIIGGCSQLHVLFQIRCLIFLLLELWHIAGFNYMIVNMKHLRAGQKYTLITVLY